jgi:hypothetical protein
MKKKSYICVLAFLAVNSMLMSPPYRTHALAEGNGTIIDWQPSTEMGPLFFEENRGQFDRRVKFSANGGDYKLFLTSNEAVYVIPERNTEEARSIRPGVSLAQTKMKPGSSRAVAVRMKLVGSNENAEAAGVGELRGKHNYLRGSDETKWQTNVPLYQRARFDSVYEGVDLEWYGSDTGAMEYDFKLSPFASAHEIEWQIDGADSVKVEADGSLVVSTPFGELKQNAPLTYQETDGLRNTVESRFEMRGRNRVGFSLGDYDESRPVTIDPVTDLSYSTFLGGESSGDSGWAIAYGSGSIVYVAGGTYSTSFPTTGGVFDNTNRGQEDVFVTKLDLNRSGAGALLYSTYIGGAGVDTAYGIAVDPSGNAYVTGTTYFAEPAYPTTTTAPYPTHSGGGSDAFVTKLNPTGSELLYSTFLGGSGSDEGRAIAVVSGSAYVTGYTTSNNYPTTDGAYDTSYGGSFDIFVTRILANGGDLGYSTYIGGSSDDRAGGVAVDLDGSAFIGGQSAGPGTYPTTPGAYQTSHNGFRDVVVTKLDPSGSTLNYSTYIGGDGEDVARAIAIDQSGNAYVTGHTTTPSTIPFPTTAGAFDRTNNGFADVFVSKVNPFGSGLVYSTLLGGSTTDIGYAIAVNSSGNAFITGSTDSESVQYPTTAGAFDVTYSGGTADAFFTKLTTTGSALLYSTLIGGGTAGNTTDSASGIALGTSGNAFITGATIGLSFPTTLDSFQPESNGFGDAFVSRFIGTPNILPRGRAPFDFDGDGRTDLSIFRPSLGQWWYLKSSDGTNAATQFGTASDKIMPADYTGDGKADIAFWRPSTGFWFVLRSENATFFSVPFGTVGDVPVPADYDADGKADTAIFRPSSSTWFVQRSGDNGTTIQQFGANGDIPVPADYDGDHRSDLAIFRPSNGQWWLNRSTEGVIVATFGNGADKPTVGDFSGDGKTDIAFWRPSNGFWFILRSEDFSFFSFPFGTTGDRPVPGDYDGDGKSDSAIFRPSNSIWYINRSSGETAISQFGIAGDSPVPAAFVP